MKLASEDSARRMIRKGSTTTPHNGGRGQFDQLPNRGTQDVYCASPPNGAFFREHNGPLGSDDPPRAVGFARQELSSRHRPPSGSVAGDFRSTMYDATSQQRAKSRWKDSRQNTAVSGQPSAGNGPPWHRARGRGSLDRSRSTGSPPEVPDGSLRTSFGLTPRPSLHDAPSVLGGRRTSLGRLRPPVPLT
jgi:hypothetical protein